MATGTLPASRAIEPQDIGEPSLACAAHRMNDVKCRAIEVPSSLEAQLTNPAEGQTRSRVSQRLGIGVLVLAMFAIAIGIKYATDDSDQQSQNNQTAPSTHYPKATVVLIFIREFDAAKDAGNEADFVAIV